MTPTVSFILLLPRTWYPVAVTRGFRNSSSAVAVASHNEKEREREREREGGTEAFGDSRGPARDGSQLANIWTKKRGWDRWAFAPVPPRKFIRNGAIDGNRGDDRTSSGGVHTTRYNAGP